MCGEGGAWLDMRKESKANVCEPLEALVLEAGRVLLVELCREHVDRKPIGEGGRRGRHVEQDGAEGEEGGERLRVGQGGVDGDRASLRVASDGDARRVAAERRHLGVEQPVHGLLTARRAENGALPQRFLHCERLACVICFRCVRLISSWRIEPPRAV